MQLPFFVFNLTQPDTLNTWISPIDQNEHNNISQNLTSTRLWVWDFDCTITNINTCIPHGWSSVKSRDLIADPDYFKSTILEGIQSGRRVAIASFARKETILAAMDDLFGYHNPFNSNNVLTPKDVGASECRGLSDGKNSLLALLEQRYQIPRSEILLLDDTYSNVKMAREAGYQSLQIPSLGCHGYHRNLDLTN